VEKGLESGVSVFFLGQQIAFILYIFPSLITISYVDKNPTMDYHQPNGSAILLITYKPSQVMYISTNIKHNKNRQSYSFSPT